MGYETKVYFVEGRSSDTDFVKDNGQWRNCFSKPSGVGDGATNFYFNSDSETVVFNKPLKVKRNEVVTRKYASPIVQLDLCKVGSLPTKESEYFIYADDGNTPVIVDRYEDFLGQMTLQEFINHIDREIQTSDYRRYKTAKAVAESMLEGYDDVQVLTYGH